MTKRVCITVVLVALAAIATAPSAGAQTVPAAADSWVTDRHPTRNYGTDRTLNAAPRPFKRTYVRFAVPTLEGSVQRAVLRIYASTEAPNGLRVQRPPRAGTSARSPTRTPPRPPPRSPPSLGSPPRERGGRST